MKINKVANKTWFKISLATDMGGGDEPVGGEIGLIGFGISARFKVPIAFIKPKTVKVFPTNWDEATIKRLGRNFYIKYTPREYSISLCENHLNIYYGLNSYDSSTEQQFGCFLPWGEWKFLRYTLYNLDGTIHANFLRKEKYDPLSFEAERKAHDTVQKINFLFKDFDGEIITAKCHIGEREWSKGVSWCSWLRFFTKNKVYRCLNLNFSAEMGRGKGSWKGGVIEQGTELFKQESCIHAFKRYCEKNNLTFISMVE